jgi:hypothetical protein
MLHLRLVEPSEAMRDLIPAPFWIAEPVDGTSRHAAGDTPDEAIANWERRHAA